MITKNKIITGVVTAATAFALFASVAGADTTTTAGNNDASDSNASKMMVNINAAGRAELAGTIAGIQSSSLTVNSWGGVWTVNVSSSTKLVRKFGGSSGLSEMQVGDNVQVTGTASKTGSWTIDAKNVMDKSIQARNANFSGTISNLSGSSFSFATKERGTVKVTVNSDAKVMVNGKTATVADLANGMVGSISGVWDKTQSTVMASKVTVRTPKTPTTGTTGTSANH